MGGFMCYGLVESYEISLAERHLPITLSVDCKLLRDIPKDHPVGYDDVVLPAGRLCDRLRAEQTEHFAVRPLRAAAPR